MTGTRQANRVRIFVGLNAVVNRNKKHLKLGSDENAGRLIPATGEVCFENNEVSRKYRNQIHAAECRIGSTAEISALREEVARLIAPESVILRKILFSGAHSGDAVPLDSIATLSAEIGSLSSAVGQSAQLRQFVDSLKELVRAAKNEGNPIVFV
jgi:hypothetical protein